MLSSNLSTTVVLWEGVLATAEETATAVDLFLRTPKVILGAAGPAAWSAGHSPHEVVVHYPLEINGEAHGSQLMVVGFPRANFLKFRLGIRMPGAVCRLDYTDETHPNSASVVSDGLPPIVRGPHYHSWPINRRFCRAGNLPARLHNATEFTIRARTFYAVLRWFCNDTNIVGLPPSHRIELPKQDTLL